MKMKGFFPHGSLLIKAAGPPFGNGLFRGGVAVSSTFQFDVISWWGRGSLRQGCEDPYETRTRAALPLGLALTIPFPAGKSALRPNGRLRSFTQDTQASRKVLTLAMTTSRSLLEVLVPEGQT